MIHMKYHNLFSSENKKKKSKLSSALVVIGALRVKSFTVIEVKILKPFYWNFACRQLVTIYKKSLDLFYLSSAENFIEHSKC